MAEEKKASANLEDDDPPNFPLKRTASFRNLSSTNLSSYGHFLSQTADEPENHSLSSQPTLMKRTLSSANLREGIGTSPVGGKNAHTAILEAIIKEGKSAFVKSYPKQIQNEKQRKKKQIIIVPPPNIIVMATIDTAKLSETDKVFRKLVLDARKKLIELSKLSLVDPKRRIEEQSLVKIYQQLLELGKEPTCIIKENYESIINEIEAYAKQFNLDLLSKTEEKASTTLGL